MTQHIRTLITAMIVAATLTLVGCEGDDEGDSEGSEGVQNVAGRWSITKVITTGPEAGRSGSGTLDLTQNGNQLGGTADPGATVSGTLNGSSISLTITANPESEWAGNVDWWNGIVSGNSMSGTWSDNQGASGNWSGTR